MTGASPAAAPEPGVCWAGDGKEPIHRFNPWVAHLPFIFVQPVWDSVGRAELLSARGLESVFWC